MRRTWIEGGDVGIGWFALDNTCRVEESLIHSKIGIGVIYPSLNMKPYRSAELLIKDSSLVTDEVLDLLLTRTPDQPIAVTFQNCVLDSKHAASLWMTPIFALEISTSAGFVDSFVRSVRWRDSECVFAEGMDYLVARRIRTPYRKYSAEIHSLRTWTDRCSEAVKEVEPGESLPSIECKIESKLPTAEDRSLWERGSPLHRFLPELPGSWRERGWQPGL